MAGLQSLSSSRIDRHTVPDGYTFGWKRGGSNLPETQSNVKCTYVSDLLHMSEEMNELHKCHRAFTQWITDPAAASVVHTNRNI